MNNKISLITFHHSLNYGANVQTYATCKILENLGYEVEVIDLRIKEHYSFIQKLIGLLRSFRFYRFRKNFIPISSRRYSSYTDLKNDPPKSDFYIVGSDQTWNPKITEDLSKAFVLDFGDRTKRRVAFSSSSGQYDWVNPENKWYITLKEALKDFYAVSVREKYLKEILENMGYKSYVTLDPSLLVSNYREIIGIPRQNNSIVSYKFVMTNEYKNLLRILAKRYKKNVNLLGHMRYERGFKYHYPVGVAKWISEIASAKIVLTDSFHGVAMCVMHNVNFVAFVGDMSKIGRIKDLLAALDLESRLYVGANFDEDKICEIIESPIDYGRVNKKLANLRSEAISFLKLALS
ncbi:MAG: polysaccharide pyruvyl transferase family protein [Bacteroides sp.]|nr:polysaccharide pyruvyl transferase family protein [Bacteroides sp.]